MKELGCTLVAVLLVAACDHGSTMAPDEEPAADMAEQVLPVGDCQNVRGTGSAVLVGPVVAEGTLQGDLETDLRVTRTDLINHGQGAVHSGQLFLPASIHVQDWEFETTNPDGVFEGADFSGVTDAKVGPVDAEMFTAAANARIELTDGAWGRLHVEGAVNFLPSPTLEFRYHGRLCGI